MFRVWRRGSGGDGWLVGGGGKIQGPRGEEGRGDRRGLAPSDSDDYYFVLSFSRLNFVQ